MGEFPQPFQRLQDALGRVPGVASVELGIQRLDGIDEEDLSLPGPLGDLPQVALRRTHGGLEHEALVTAELTFHQDREGWRGLEFLAWWVRDHARGGDDVQMRALALPPEAFDRQLGRTLKFVIELFLIDPSEDGGPVLEAVDELAESLDESIDLYAEALGDSPDREPSE